MHFENLTVDIDGPVATVTLHKQAVNRWSELMGARVAALEMVDMDALYHTTPAYSEFGRRIAEHGLDHALAWRDGPFREAGGSDSINRLFPFWPRRRNATLIHFMPGQCRRRGFGRTSAGTGRGPAR